MHREKRHLRTRAYASSERRRIKLCFPGENTRGTGARRVPPVHSMPGIPVRGAISGLCGARPEKCSRKKRSLRLREKAPLYPPPAAAMNFDGSFFPPRSFSAGTTLICIMQFTRARARIVSKYTWPRSREKTACISRARSFFRILFSLPFSLSLYIFYHRLSIRGPSRPHDIAACNVRDRSRLKRALS